MKVQLERTLAAPPAEVYRAWLEPGLLRRWIGPGQWTATHAEVDARIGGQHRVWHVDPDGVDMGGTEGVFVELVPAERIVLRWQFVGPDRSTTAAEESLLTVTFRPGPRPNTTALTLVHERLDGLRAAHPEIAGLVEAGWASVLEKLKKLSPELESRDGN